MSYKRVIPRDLFNEADLLKCLGRVALLIEDGFVPEGLVLQHDSPDDGFPIEQNPSSGDIYCRALTLHTRHGQRVRPYRLLNNKSPWPLYIWSEDEEEIPVFEEDGTFTPEFRQWASRAGGAS